jgi:hypothetical protein
LAFILGELLLCGAGQVLYTINALGWARGEGVYDTPQQGVIARANRWYCGVEKIDIEQAATNSFDGSNPHIWYVIWRVTAKNRAPCDPDNPGPPLAHGKSSEGGGNYYLNTREGWVYMPEGRFPELIGFWMKVLGLAGPGDSTHVPRN